MLAERKRDAAANALLALSFAANAASSPENLIRSGHDTSPGVQLMSRMMTKRKEANRNLDNPRVVSRGSKTFKEFMEDTTTTQRLKIKTIEAIKKYKNNPEKIEVYKNLLNKIRERHNPNQKLDDLRRASARKDKYLIPSHRTSSFPELSGIKTITKNPKKLRKQKAIGEIS